MAAELRRCEADTPPGEPADLLSQFAEQHEAFVACIRAQVGSVLSGSVLPFRAFKFRWLFYKDLCRSRAEKSGDEGRPWQVGPSEQEATHQPPAMEASSCRLH